MSFKTYEQIQFATSIYVPNPFTWENYTGLWTETRFPLWLRNSLVTALVVTAITTVIASLGGYAVARLRFPGRESVASLILILYLIPPALLFIPLYRVLAELGATNHLVVALPVLPDLHGALLHLAPDRLLQGAARRAGGGGPDRRGRPGHRVRARAAAAGRAGPRGLGHLRLHALLERVPLRAGLHPGRDGHHGAGGPQPAHLRRRLPLGPAHGRLRHHHRSRWSPSTCSSTAGWWRGWSRAR